MRRASSIATVFGLTLCILSPREAGAEQFDATSVVYGAARNKIGLFRYCENNASLDSLIAERAIDVIEIGLSTLPLENERVREEGDRAEAAGEDGFLEAGRRRTIAGFAELFRTTRASLCEQWAEETLRSQESTPGNAISIATIEPTRIGLRIATPSPDIERPSPAPRAAELPPVPTKSLFRSGDAQLVPPQQQTLNTVAQIGGNPPSSPQIMSTAAQVTNPPEPFSRQRPVPAPLFDARCAD